MVIKACDRCYTRKEKCTFISNDQPCTRCRRLKIACSTTRHNRRMGRWPAVKAFSHGEMQVWSIDSRQQFGPSQSQPQPCREPMSSNRYTVLGPLGRHSKSSLPSSDLTSSADSAKEVRSLERSNAVALGPEKLLASPTTLKTASDAFRIVLDSDQFLVICLPFLLGPSFLPTAQKRIYTLLRLSGPTLTEPYSAVLGLMIRYQRSLVMRPVQPDMVKAAKGLQYLRSVKITKESDAACALFLGQIMYAFHTLTALDSSTAHSILRSALISTKDWVPRLVHFRIMDSSILTPILIDTVECLVRRSVPIIRLPSIDRNFIHSYVGVCATLLPLLYDLCECSNAMKRGVLDIGVESLSGYDGRLADIEKTIIEWKPPSPPQLFIEHEPHERLAIMTQAKVYRLAALLIIHRLRYPLGVEDETAREFANGILSYMSFFAQSAVKEPTALPVVFPLTMAMIEIEEPCEGLWDRVFLFAVQGMCATRLRGFIKQIRASRESGYEGIWFDLVDKHLQSAVPP